MYYSNKELECLYIRSQMKENCSMGNIGCMKGTWQKLKTIIAAICKHTRWNLLPTGKHHGLNMDHCSIHDTRWCRL